ncbi:MAG: hypothetical protein GF364_17300 [Candidatus Lokiarchaeota archaeon]|nr:hypothetical protein [Candidatus Lokiarchaeota archaeon]
MAATHIHVIINVIIWYFLFFIVNMLKIDTIIIGLNNAVNGLYFILGGFIFDIDHIFYYVLTTKPLNFANIKQRMEVDFEEENPHPYIFHSIEFIILSLVISSTNDDIVFQLLISGWILHMITDSIYYIRHYKSFRPWVPYFSLAYLIYTSSFHNNEVQK